MAFKFFNRYSHAGIALSPKLVYKLPAAMQNFMEQNNLGEVVSDPVDEDMSHLPWDGETSLLPNGGTVTPRM